MAPPLSRRARQLIAEQDVAPFLAEHMNRVGESWSPDNPGGYIGWCLAENTLVWDLLADRATSSRSRRHEDFRYDNRLGNRALREVLANHVGQRIFQRPVDADDVVVIAGAGTVLEILFHCLCDPGDGVLVPTPSYNGFWSDLTVRDEAIIIPVHTSPDTGFELTTDLLDQALDTSTVPVTSLLWTNPDNPTGTVATRDQVETIVAWAKSRGLHLVADEIYAGSVFGDVDFTSVGEVLPSLGEDVHWVWSLSKDFGASGLRAGALVTGNAAIVDAARVLTMQAMVSGDTQALVRDLLGDQEWTDGFLAESTRRLGQAHSRVAEGLDAAGIPRVHADAGVFLLVDLRKWLDEPTWEAEDRLWRRILDEANVNLTPGAKCRIVEPGFFRLVFGAVPVEASSEGVRRLSALLGQRHR